MSRSPQGVVFDLDGTLLDTERVAREAFVAACTAIDWPVDLALYNRCVGSTGEGTRKILMAGYGPEFPFDEMERHWAEHYHAVVLHEPVPVKEGVVELVETLSARNCPLAVASSSRRENVTSKLELAGLSRYFEFYVCGGESEFGKPHPAPYLDAVGQLGLRPEHCWAVEDSENGVRSALAAGMVVFQIPDEIEPSNEVRAMGHNILSSALEILELVE